MHSVVFVGHTLDTPDMIVLTLEGLPHSGKCAILRCLMHRCPGWKAMNVAPTPAPSCSWSSPACRSGHAMFAALLRKVRALSALATPGQVVMFNCPWFEYLPRSEVLEKLHACATERLIRRLKCSVRLHIMVLLHVHHNETFEQMVSCGNPFWNGTSLADVQAAQHAIQHNLEHLGTRPQDHPFPCLTYCIKCPPFFEENEIVTNDIVQTIIDIVNLKALPDGETHTS